MLNLKTEQEQFEFLAEVSPMATAVFTGTEMVIAAANEPMLKIWGRGKKPIGLPLLQALPELVGQSFFGNLQEVYRTGTTYYATEARADLRVEENLETFFFTFIYKALKNKDGKIIGVINTAIDVTELVRNRQKVAEAQSKLKFALGAAEIGTWSFDVSTGMILLDEESLMLIERAAPKDFLYEQLFQYVYPADRRAVATTIYRATTSAQSGELDLNFRIYTQNLNLIWIKCKGKAYFDQDQKLQQFGGIILNITGELTRQAELQRLAAIVDSSEDFCDYTDILGKVLYINPAGRKLIGLDHRALPNAEDFSYHETNYQNKIKNEILPILLKKGSWSGKLKLINQETKRLIPIHKQFHLIRDEVTNTPLFIAGIAKDLTNELEIRRILADKNKDLRTIVLELEFLANTVPSVVWTSTPDGALDYVNKRWFDQTGKTGEETLGFKWIDAVFPADRDGAGLLWQQSLSTGKLYEGEFRIVSKGGEYRWFLVRALPLKNAEGEIVKWYGTNTDIQHQKELEKQKDDFLAIASHELKTPVTSLKAYTQVVEAMFVKSGDERNATLLNRMNKQIDRLTKLIDDLLNVTKISKGKLELEFSRFNFKDLIEEVVEEVGKTSSKHRINKTVAFLGEVFSDRGRIYQVLVNLLTNAIKYSPNSSEIDVSVVAEKKVLKVHVKDYGIGIDKDLSDRVFEQFYRVQGESDHTYAGMGLGLYICADIIKRLGGEIWVDSIQDQGSTFSFTVPLGT